MIKNSNLFKLQTTFRPSGDQPKAIDTLFENLINKQKKYQVLLGATGTGKTFTIANIICKMNKPTLVLAHNKTLAMQLYVELKELFPTNRVEYFVSNFDFYQPEAYLPTKDLYIDKDARRNAELDMMRTSSLNALVTRKDTIVVASVAAIYATQNPHEYSSIFYEIYKNKKLDIKEFINFLVRSGYQRGEDLLPSNFIVKGDVIILCPAWTDQHYYRISLFDDLIESLDILEPLNNSVKERVSQLTIFPATSYVTDNDKLKIAIENIKRELKERLEYFYKQNKIIEADRLNKRTNYDLETLSEFGICHGIENYSAQLEFRKPYEMPFTLIDYFGKDFLTIIDESHIMIPQIRGMYNTDHSRKLTLVEHGFRLPSALDNRPLNFEEFTNKLKQVIFTSATPAEYELQLTQNEVVEQIIRPTGLLDPIVKILPTTNQMNEIISLINQKIKLNQRTFITTLTKKMSEEVTNYLQERNLKVAYLHSDLKTIERNTILNDLRRKVYDVVVGVNLLREGIDVPEIGLVCILDADKEGFLRNTRSLIQTIGRAARNADGMVIFFADKITKSMQEAIDETNRRRSIQKEYNKQNNIIPKTIEKKIVQTNSEINKRANDLLKANKKNKIKIKDDLLKSLRKEMLQAAQELNFEKAAELRDLIIEINGE